MTLDTVLLVGALICFIIAALGVNGRINLVAAGLALLTASMLF